MIKASADYPTTFVGASHPRRLRLSGGRTSPASLLSVWTARAGACTNVQGPLARRQGQEQASSNLPTDGVEDHHGGEVGLLMGGQQREHRGRESVQGITVANVKGRAGDRPRLPFDNGNLRKLFSVERKGAANYWVPLLGLYQGARLEELARWATSTG